MTSGQAQIAQTEKRRRFGRNHADPKEEKEDCHNKDPEYKAH
jgi:hypothetical protein